MKKILLILGLLCATFIKAQDIPPTGNNFKQITSHSVSYYVTDSSVWLYKGATYGWSHMATFRNLNFKIDSISHVVGNYKLNNDSVNNSGYTTLYRNGLKVNISDTALMLYPYEKKLVVAKKVNISDTAHMLSPYAKILSVALKLNITDTASMLANYAKTSLVNTKLNKSDTASMLSPYAKNSLVATKLNIADTTVMLSPYARTLTVNNALLLKKNKSDSTNTDGYVRRDRLTSSLATKFTLPALTSGSVLFSNGTTISQDNNNLFWDATNKRLGIGKSTPGAALEILPNNSAYTNSGLIIRQSWTGDANVQTLLSIIDRNGVERVSVKARGSDGSSGLSVGNLGTVSASDNTGMSFLTSGSGAQSINVNGIFMGASYDGVKTNTGIIRTSSGTNITLSPAGNAMMTLASSAVGVKNTSPSELLTLGTSGTTAGNLSLAGLTSGKAILQVQAAAGTPTLTLPTTTGTLALRGDSTIFSSAYQDGLKKLKSDSINSDGYTRRDRLASSLATKQNTIGYTPENVANKVTSFSSPTDTQYPSAKLVNDQLALKKDKSDSTNTDGYTRRDRLTSSLALKKDKVDSTNIDGYTRRDRLTSSLALKVNISDTASMLSHYKTEISGRVKYSDTTAMFTNYKNEINGRVRYADTTSMLSPYRGYANTRVKYSDTTAMFTNYKTEINNRVKYADTASMFTNYKTEINGRVKYADTTAILSHYKLKSDSTATDGYTRRDRLASELRQTVYPYGGVAVLPSYTDNGNGSVTIGTGTYILNTATDGSGRFNRYTVSGGTFTLTDNVSNYIIIDYNGGSPIVRNTTNSSDVNDQTTQPIYTLSRMGTYIGMIDWDTQGNSLSNKLLRRLRRTERFTIEPGGLMIGEVATRQITVSGGTVWYGAASTVIPSSQSGDGTTQCKLFVYNGSTWTMSLITQYTNSQYQGATGLASLGNNKYGIIWVYKGVEADKDQYVVYGIASYGSIAAAASATTPTNLPSIIPIHTIFVGRIIVQNAASSASEIDSPFNTNFVSNIPNDHSQLSNLGWTVSGHTGTATTVAGFDGSGSATYYSYGGANGVATLDAGSKIPIAQLPSTTLLYKGLYDATTNTPALHNLSGGLLPADAQSGWVYQISNTTNPYIGNRFGVQDTLWNGDFIMYNGSVWEVSAWTDGVKSVNAKQGVVTLTTDNISEGSNNKYYLDSRARAALGKSDPITYNSGTGTIGITQSSGSSNGYLSSTDWTTFNNKQPAGSYDNYQYWTFKTNGTTGDNITSTAALNFKGVGTTSVSRSATNEITISSADQYVGTVTSVTAGDGMTQTGTSTVNPTLNIVSNAGVSGSIGTINVGADAIGVDLGTSATTAYRGDYGNAAYNGRIATFSTTGNSGAATFSGNTLNIPNYTLAGLGGISGNQNITLSGDITGSGATAITTTLATVNSNIGTFNNLTVNAKGLVTGASNISYQPLATVLTNTTASYTTAIDTRLANTSGTNTGDNAVNSLYSGLATSKQDALVSGTNIKTINSTTLLGSGNFDLEPAFSKNTAFNKNFGTTTGTVLEGRTFGTMANASASDYLPLSAGSGNALSGNLYVGSDPGNDNATKTIIIGGSAAAGKFSGGIGIRNYWNNAPYEAGIYTKSYTNADAGLDIRVGYYNGSGAAQRTPMSFNPDGTIILPLITAGSAGNFVVSNSGTLVTRTASQVLSDIGAAPASGSGNYIQNQNSGAQVAEQWINGTIRAGWQLISDRNITSTGSLSTLNPGSVNLDVGDGSRILSLGLNATTRGAFKIALAASDAGMYLTPLSIDNSGAATFSSTVGATQFQSTVAQGTAPFTVASTTMVSNLNADLLDDRHADPVANANTIVQRDQYGDVYARVLRMSSSSGDATPVKILNMQSDGSIFSSSAAQVQAFLGLNSIATQSTSSLTTNYLPKWNGNSFVNSLISDDGTYNMFLYGNGGSANADPALSFSRFSPTDASQRGAKIQYIYNDATIQESGSIAFFTNPSTGSGNNLTERMRVNYDGQIQIKSNISSTSSTTGALVVGGGIGVGGKLWANDNILSNGYFISNNSSTARYVGLFGTPSTYVNIYGWDNTGAVPIPVVMQNNAAAVFIGYTSDPTSDNKLAVNGNGYFGGSVTTTGGATIGGLSGTGTRMVVADGSGSLSTQSIPYIPTVSDYIQNTTTQQSGDANFNISGNGVLGGSITAAGGGFNSIRSIKNIHNDWTGSALNELMKFKLRDFNYKARPDYDETLGFIVDEIPASVSNYVLSGKNKDAINTYSMIGLEVKALQEANTKIESLEKRVDDLEKAISTLIENNKKCVK